MRKRSSTLPRLPLPNISLSVGIAAPILLARTPACMLANEQMPAAMNRQATLLLSCLGLHEPHVRPANGLADCLCVSGIVLLPLHVGLQGDQPPWGDEAHRMVSTGGGRKRVPLARRGERP